MTTGLSERKRELIMVVITAIVLALAINLLSNILFDFFKADYLKQLLFATIGTILLFTLAVILLVFRYSKSHTTEISFPLSFDRSIPRFNDIPYCAPSVHARVNFDNLPPAGRSHFLVYDEFDKFWGTDFNRFIDNTIQEWLLTVVFNGRSVKKKNLSRISFDKLPEGIRENNLLKNWWKDKDEMQLHLPDKAKLTTFGRHNSFLKIASFFGSTAFSWDISFFQVPSLSRPFLKNYDIKEIDNCHDFQINIKMSIDCNFIPFFSGRLKRFCSWIEQIEQCFLGFDWERRQMDRLVNIIGDKGGENDF